MPEQTFIGFLKEFIRLIIYGKLHKDHIRPVRHHIRIHSGHAVLRRGTADTGIDIGCLRLRKTLLPPAVYTFCIAFIMHTGMISLCDRSAQKCQTHRLSFLRPLHHCPDTLRISVIYDCPFGIDMVIHFFASSKIIKYPVLLYFITHTGCSQGVYSRSQFLVYSTALCHLFTFFCCSSWEIRGVKVLSI